MDQALVVLEGWWTVDPWLTGLGVAIGAILLVILLLPVGVLCSPAMRIVYRAMRRVIWLKVGDSRQDPPFPRAYQKHLEKKKTQRLLMSAEGAAFGRTGVIYLTPEEIGFVSRRFGMLTENNVPFAQINEAKIHKTWLYDYVTITTSERSEKLRLYRSDRDLGQEFFNHLQMRLGAMRFRKA